MPLNLKELGDGLWPRALFFATPELACRHIAAHLLTRPESESWAFLVAKEGMAPDYAGHRARFRVAQTILIDDVSAEPLYETYYGLSRLAVQSTKLTGWCWDHSGDKKFFGIQGILVIANSKCVRSSMLPGQGIPILNHSTPTPEDPLPRQKGKDGCGFGGRRRQRQRAHEMRERERWRQQRAASPELTEEEQEGWRLFFRCALAVRKELLGAYKKQERSGLPAPPAETFLSNMANPREWRELSVEVASTKGTI
jgi:hypothetical protein